MTWLDWLAVTSLGLAAWPAILYSRNIRRYRKPAVSRVSCLERSGLSILIPARNEEATIRDSIAAALASLQVDVEVLVLDDHSTDRTAAIVETMSVGDPRVRVIHGKPLPSGWAGKQFACWRLAYEAKYEYLLFIDADVRLAPDGAIHLISFLRQTDCGLVSGVPRQETGSTLERLVIPLIHFLLLSYLPMGQMRKSRSPALGAGCGQLFLTTASAYRQSGGHEAIKNSFHDGVKLPRAYRRAGLWTDLCDATDVATCRMYPGGRELWNGLAKNAGEGIGSAIGIWLWTALLFGGHVLPFALIAMWPLLTWSNRIAVSIAVALSWYPRIDATRRFHQSWMGLLLHPFGIGMLLIIQWYAMLRRIVGRPVGWKGRSPLTR